MIKKILIIPHASELHIRKRLMEIGRVLSKIYDVYMLHWSEPVGTSIPSKTTACFTNFFKSNKIYGKDGILFAQYPFIYRPLFMSKVYNASSLGKFISEFKIDTVINGANHLFPTPFSKKCQHIFDLNSLPYTGNNTALNNFVDEFAKREAQKADAVTTSSLGLADYAKTKFNRKAYFVPNGTYLADFRLDFEEVKRIRTTFNLLNKFVIGFTGYIDENIDADFLIDLFLDLRKYNRDIVFMVIGLGPNAGIFKKQVKDNNFIFINKGTIRDLSSYLFAFNIGVLPCKKSPSQDLAFNEIIIDYTAAKKFVISSPLEEVKKLKFPNVITAGLNTKEWVSAIENARSMRWDSAWDNLTADYDWKKIAEKFAGVIESQMAVKIGN